jgi:hypothetical protein
VAFIVASAVALSTLVVPAVALAASPSPSPGASQVSAGNQVVLFGRVIVPRGQSVSEVVVFSGRVSVAGVVRGDVVVLDGPIVVSGQVSGSVIALAGSVRLSSSAQVAGDVLAHDRAIIAEGAQVDGSIREGVSFTIRGPLRALGVFLSWLAVAVSTLMLGLVFAAIAPSAMDRVALAGRSAPFASGGWGLALAVGLPILAVAAVALVVGMPLGLAVLLASLMLAFIGIVSTAHTVGRLLVRDDRGTATAFLAGWGIASIVGLVPIVSGIVFALSSVFGLGEVTVAIWRARGTSRRGRHRRGTILPPSAFGDQAAPGVSPLPPD